MKWPFRSRIIRHEEPNKTEFASGGSPFLELIDQHITEHVGEPQTVIHEIASEFVHIDVHVVPPRRPGRDFYTLITSGMSDRPMMTPRQAKGRGFEFAELMLCMPSSWKIENYEVLTGESSEKDWPVIWLRRLARFPHEYKTWLWWGHSIPNGDPPLPLSTNTQLCGWTLTEPKLVPDSFKLVTRPDGTKIFFFAVVPVYKEEMAIKIAQGAEKLEELFEECAITELIDPNRKNVGATHAPPRQ